MGQKAATAAAPPLHKAQPPGRPTHVRFLVLGLACLLAVLIYLHRVGFGQRESAEAMQTALSLSSQQWGLAMSAFLVAYAFFEVPCGLLGDRLGVRRLLTVLMLGSSLLTAAVVLVPALPQPSALPFLILLASRFLCGAFQAGVFPSVSRMMADWMPVAERGTAQGWVWMAARAGGALSPLAMLGLARWLGGWQWPLLVFAALGVAWCAVFYPWFRDRPEQMPRVGPQERSLIVAERRIAGKHQGLPWREASRSRNVWGLCLVYGLIGAPATFFITLLPRYLSSQRHLPPETVSWLSSLPLACGVVGCLLGGMLSDAIIRRGGGSPASRRWGRRLPGLVGYAVAAAAFTATIWVEHPVALGLLLCLTFFGNDLAMGPIWAACADVGDRYAGTLGGAMNTFGNLAPALVSPLTGWFFDRGDTTTPFLYYGAGFALAAGCWLLIDVTRPLTADPES